MTGFISIAMENHTVFLRNRKRKKEYLVHPVRVELADGNISKNASVVIIVWANNNLALGKKDNLSHSIANTCLHFSWRRHTASKFHRQPQRKIFPEKTIEQRDVAEMGSGDVQD